MPAARLRAARNIRSPSYRRCEANDVEDPGASRLVPARRLGTLALHRGLPAALAVPRPWNWLGLAPVAVGLALGLSAARLFRRAATPVTPWETPSALVAAGPYRFIRNPMYLGLALCLSGLAVWLGTLTPFLVIPLFVWVITARFILGEEQRLETRFGDQYRAYKARVRRWI